MLIAYFRICFVLRKKKKERQFANHYGLCIYADLCSKKIQIAAVILPSLQRLHGSLEDFDVTNEGNLRMEISCKKRLEGDGRLTNVDLEREDECGICLEPCTKMVLPNCCHSMCIKCYRNW